MNIANSPLAFTDVETSALDPANGRIVEVAIEICSAWPEMKVIDTFTERYSLSPYDFKRAEAQALKVNGYDHDIRVKTCVTANYGNWTRVRDMLTGVVLCGQNPDFDARWLTMELHHTGCEVPWQRRMVDTQSYCHIVACERGLDGWGLHRVYDELGGPPLPPHQAMPDVQRAKYVYSTFRYAHRGAWK